MCCSISCCLVTCAVSHAYISDLCSNNDVCTFLFHCYYTMDTNMFVCRYCMYVQYVLYAARNIRTILYDCLLHLRYLVTHLMGSDLNQIIKTQSLTDEHVQLLIYQILRGLKVMCVWGGTGCVICEWVVVLNISSTSLSMQFSSFPQYIHAAGVIHRVSVECSLLCVYIRNMSVFACTNTHACTHTYTTFNPLNI